MWAEPFFDEIKNGSQGKHSHEVKRKMWKKVKEIRVPVELYKKGDDSCMR